MPTLKPKYSFRFGFGSAGQKPGQFKGYSLDHYHDNFQGINGITIGPNGDYYVADTGNNRIQVFHRDGAFVNVLDPYGGLQLFYPVALAFDINGL